MLLTNESNLEQITHKIGFQQPVSKVIMDLLHARFKY